MHWNINSVITRVVLDLWCTSARLKYTYTIIVIVLNSKVFDNICIDNWGRSSNCFRRVPISRENCLLASSCPSRSVCLSVSALLPLGGFPWNLVLGGGASVKICRITPNFVKIGRKYRALYLKTEVGFIVIDDSIKSPIKALSSTDMFSGC